MRIAVVGHFTWFENHFPENWRSDTEVLCVDANEGYYSWLLCVRNFRPQVTLFFRPELYPRHYVESIPGLRVALLSEPVPVLRNDAFEHTSETDLRLAVYRNMSWPSYHWRIYYDKGKAESIARLGYPIDEFRPLPIDTSIFCPPSGHEKRPPSYDICFVGKPTAYRIAKLDFLRSSHLSFLWVAHGMSGAELGSLFQRSRIVLNVHADAKEAMEPRIYLGAACGALVVSEPLSSPPSHFRDRIIEVNGDWSDQVLGGLLEREDRGYGHGALTSQLLALSARRLVDELCQRWPL